MVVKSGFTATTPIGRVGRDRKLLDAPHSNNQGGAPVFHGCLLRDGIVAVEAPPTQNPQLILAYENDPYCHFTGVRLIGRRMFALGKGRQCDSNDA